MNRTYLLMVGLVGVLAAAVVAQPQPGSDDPADRAMKRWDRNGDGRLSRDELPERLRKNFDRVDRNGDGFISLEEHRAVLGRRRDGARPAQPDISNRWPNVEVKRDLPYAGTANPRQRLDLYLPKERKGEKPLPVVVFIHGGAWRGGDKRSGAGMVAPYVETGRFAGASIAYRLSGEAIWPAQIHDCKAAIRWLKANAKTYNLDADRIGPFTFRSLDIGVVPDRGGPPRIETVRVKERKNRFFFPCDAAPAEVVLDPDTWLLMEVKSFGEEDISRDRSR